MNVFKKKAKAKDDAYIVPPAGRSDSPTLAKMSRSLKRKQKTVVEAKPEIDLSVALPDKNDFRTSLLMPGLSARFSMLREQDDPNTKVGKASDDSVLFPKRASRLNLFAHNPLTDIAEVESVRGSLIKPPFANERSNSFSEGAGHSHDDGSSRSKLADGNSLFSGRQKMYRIQGGGSNRDLSATQPSLTSAKHVYQNDVAMSSFQRLHSNDVEDPEEQEDLEERGDDFPERPISTETDDHEHSSVVNTPSTGFSKSRGTTSSTASGPSNRRISTAATSLVSDSPVPRQSQVSAGSHGSHAKGTAPDYGPDDEYLRRNPSSESRRGGREGDDKVQPPLPSSPLFTRQLSQSRSLTNMSEGDSREASPFPSLTPRPSSPAPPLQSQALASLDFGLKSTVAQSRRYQTASPTTEDEDGDVYVKNIGPNDRGKATAMGLFNRPSQPFDEQKFQERQLQMHEDRTLPPAAVSTPEAELTMLQQEKASPADPNCPPSIPEKDPSRAEEPSDKSINGRSRALSASATSAAQIQARVEALIKRQNEEYTALQAKSSSAEDPAPGLKAPETLMDQPVASSGTFLDTFASDEDEEVEVDSPMLGRYEPAPRLVPMEVHPALRDGTHAFDFGDQVSSSVQVARPSSNASADTSHPSVMHDTSEIADSLHRSSGTNTLDSPTLGPATGLGLSGLIRTHLRHDSDKSSLMPPPSPIPHFQHSNFSSRHRDPSIASTARTTNPPESTHSDPWEFDNAHRPQRSPMEHPSSDPISTMSQKAQQILGQAMSHRNYAATKAQQVLGSNAPTDTDENAARFQNDMSSGHQRGESTETQKEFGNELAERAKRIQEGLKGVTEAEKRSRSPFRPDRQNPAAHALQALRYKASKTSLAPRGIEPHPKAMKMLGLKSGPLPDTRGRSEFADAYDEYGSRPVPRQRATDFEHIGGRATPSSARAENGFLPHPEDGFDRSRQRSATPNARGPRRDREDAEHAERSRSRAGRNREEPPYSPAEFGKMDSPTPWEHQRPYQGPQGHRGYQGPPKDPPVVEPRNYERSASAMSNRRPSASRPSPSSYFDSRAPTPTMANTPQLGGGPLSMTAPRPSPRPPLPPSPFLQPGASPRLASSPSASTSALPSPVGPVPQPPTAGRVTPVDGRPTLVGMRKKSIVKGMISEPTFISSTSSVPLIGLPKGPHPSQNPIPPIPAMNPRRRANTQSEKTDEPSTPQLSGSPMPESPNRTGQAMAAAQRAFIEQKQQQQEKAPRQRNRLRKISSEGGSMAARARNQAMMAEFGREKLRSPALPVFPNRSATSLSMRQDGAMF